MPAHEKPCSAERFRELVEEVRSVYPPPRGTRIVFRRLSSRQMDGLFGVTTQKSRTFKIEIRSDLTFQETEDCVLHEYAHVLTWRPYHPITSDHDAAWGVAFAELYRAYNGAR